MERKCECPCQHGDVLNGDQTGWSVLPKEFDGRGPMYSKPDDEERPLRAPAWRGGGSRVGETLLDGGRGPR